MCALSHKELLVWQPTSCTCTDFVQNVTIRSHWLSTCAKDFCFCSWWPCTICLQSANPLCVSVLWTWNYKTASSVRLTSWFRDDRVFFHGGSCMHEASDVSYTGTCEKETEIIGKGNSIIWLVNCWYRSVVQGQGRARQKSPTKTKDRGEINLRDSLPWLHVVSECDLCMSPGAKFTVRWSLWLPSLRRTPQFMWNVSSWVWWMGREDGLFVSRVDPNLTNASDWLLSKRTKNCPCHTLCVFCTKVWLSWSLVLWAQNLRFQSIGQEIIRNLCQMQSSSSCSMSVILKGDRQQCNPDNTIVSKASSSWLSRFKKRLCRMLFFPSNFLVTTPLCSWTLEATSGRMDQQLCKMALCLGQFALQYVN